MATATAGRTLQIQTPRVFAPLLKPSRYKGAYGGRGSAKSHFFAESVVEWATYRSGSRIVCIREIQLSLKQSVKRLLEDKLDHYNLGTSDGFRVKEAEIETPGNGVIIFQGMQNHNSDTIKSLEGFDLAWFEEAQSASDRSLTLLRPTIRKDPTEKQPWGSEIWFSWNPRSPKDPVDKFLRGPHPHPKAVVVQANFRDNPWFPQVLREEMEYDREHDKEKYEHVWLGGYEKHSESRVFKNWRVEDFETPKDTHFSHGADWGFSVDPSTLVRLFVDKDNPKRLLIDREVYKIGCEIDHLPALFDKLDPDNPGSARPWPIVADSARPETISYMQRHGYPQMRAAIKGPNSVKEGVIFLQGYEIIIHPRCVHTIDEFTMYSYVVDKITSEVTNVLEDKKNHVIDPVRYATESLRAGVRRVLETQWG